MSIVDVIILTGRDSTKTSSML